MPDRPACLRLVPRASSSVTAALNFCAYVLLRPALCLSRRLAAVLRGTRRAAPLRQGGRRSTAAALASTITPRLRAGLDPQSRRARLYLRESWTRAAPSRLLPLLSTVSAFGRFGTRRHACSELASSRSPRSARMSFRTTQANSPASPLRHFLARAQRRRDRPAKATYSHRQCRSRRDAVEARAVSHGGRDQRSSHPRAARSACIGTMRSRPGRHQRHQHQRPAAPIGPCDVRPGLAAYAAAVSSRGWPREGAAGLPSGAGPRLGSELLRPAIAILRLKALPLI
jgi:hypothetical protein